MATATRAGPEGVARGRTPGRLASATRDRSPPGRAPPSSAAGRSQRQAWRIGNTELLWACRVLSSGEKHLVDRVRGPDHPRRDNKSAGRLSSKHAQVYSPGLRPRLTCPPDAAPSAHSGFQTANLRSGGAGKTARARTALACPIVLAGRAPAGLLIALAMLLILPTAVHAQTDVWSATLTVQDTGPLGCRGDGAESWVVSQFEMAHLEGPEAGAHGQIRGQLSMG